jgi:hypothetical protein
MKFFFPDSQDQVDPSFDFATETRSPERVRHRDDLYAHEVFPEPPYDGLLLSKAMIDGSGGEASGRYSLAQRHRLFREGVRRFFRLGDRPLETMGDCGAFAYVREEVPPVSVDQVIAFYEECGFDYGVSVDHIILAYQPDCDRGLPGIDLVPPEWRRRQEITLELAARFLGRHRAGRCRFRPVGVAQGWSPASYARSVGDLQKMGYRLIGLGGMVPLKTDEILACLEAADAVRRPETRFHLFGVTRPLHLGRFRAYGVASCDSTSPLRQAFKDDRDNYYTPKRTYPAIRVPQVEENPRMRSRIVAGAIDQAEARRLERACLRALTEYDRGRGSAEQSLRCLRQYEQMHDGRKDRTREYREVLAARPWKDCPCTVCRHLGIHVLLFRGAERNRRRGFHNLFVTYQKLRRESAAGSGV